MILSVFRAILFVSVARAELPNEALRWFPARTETILASRDGFDLPSRTIEDKHDEDLLESFTVSQLSLPFLLDMLQLPKEETRLNFAGRRIVWAVLGATSLGRANGGWDGIPLGVGFYKGCLVLELAGDLPSAITTKPYRMTMTHNGKPTRTKEMWIHKQFIKLRERLLMACNDEEYFEETLRGFQFPVSKSAFEQSEVWRSLRADSRLWGMRRNGEMEMLFQHLPRSASFQIDEVRPQRSSRTIRASVDEEGVGKLWELIMKLGLELSI
jgi:hypothetical protein